MSEIFLLPLGLLVVAIALPTFAYILISLFDGFPRLRIGQIAGIVAVVAWFLTPIAISAPDEGPFLSLTAVGLTLTFFVLWRREFRHLMLRGDDEFPGRHDKIGWFLILTLAAPAGVWLYRSYRQVRWPEALAAARGPDTSTPRRPSQSPWDHDEIDALSPARAGVE